MSGRGHIPETRDTNFYELCDYTHPGWKKHSHGSLSRGGGNKGKGGGRGEEGGLRGKERTWDIPDSTHSLLLTPTLMRPSPPPPLFLSGKAFPIIQRGKLITFRTKTSWGGRLPFSRHNCGCGTSYYTHTTRWPVSSTHGHPRRRCTIWTTLPLSSNHSKSSIRKQIKDCPPSYLKILASTEWRSKITLGE